MKWAKRIEAARAKGTFAPEDRELANDWVTCACGEQDSRIPRYNNTYFPSGQPRDRELANHGFEFLVAVNHNKSDDAAKVLDKIEIRSAQILADLDHGEPS